MKKYLPLLFGLGLLALLPGASFAQSGAVQSMPAQTVPAMPAKNMPLVPIPPQTTLPFGQSHFYTVTLRGNGDAIVYLKTVFSNKGEASLSEMKFTFPKAPQNLAVYQVSREPQCISYKPTIMTLDSQSNAPAKDMLMRGYYPPEAQECAEYQEPDYQYGWGNATYAKAQATLEGDAAIVTLPKPVKSFGAGSLIFAYSLPQITKRDLFGAYDFAFDTVKVDDTIKDLQVGLMTDPDYYLKDAKGTINYQAKDTVSFAGAAPMVAERAVSNAQFDQFYSQIGQGTVVKSAANLQSNESYATRGTYADSKIKLYSKELLWGIFGVVIFLVFAFGLLYWGGKKLGKVQPVKTFAFIPVLGLSFSSSLGIVVYTGVLFGLSYFFGQFFQYSYSFIYPLLFLMLAIISLSVYSLLLFAPGLFLGIKKGMLAGIITVILTIFWLIFYSIVLVGLLFLFSNNNSGPVLFNQSFIQPMGVMRGGGVAVDSVAPPAQIAPAVAK
jgi:hypothetical protein